MGNFFGGPKVSGVDIDLDNVKVTDHEMKMHDEMEEVLSQMNDVLAELKEYEGCQDLIKAAMGKIGGGDIEKKNKKDNTSNEKTAFEALLICVKKIKNFNDFAEELGRTFPSLLEFLSEGAEGRSVAELDKQQALSVQLGKVLDFTLRFDGLRMMKPEIPNDFSYYRRLLPKYSGSHPGIEIKEDMASAMAMFIAEPTPLANVLVKSALKVMQDTPAVTVVLSTLVNSCMLMLKQQRFKNPDTSLFCLRAMTGAIVLFDHVDEQGAFAKKSAIDIKQCVTIMKKDFPEETNLLNSIHYSTKNFSNASYSVQALFD